MKSVFDKLNLRPGERRLVVIVGIVIFIVLNVWFIFPNFGQLGIKQQRIKDTETKLQRFKMEINRRPTYERELRSLENQGVFVGQEDQALQLSREVTSQAQLTGVTVLRSDPSPRTSSGRTNAFFDESALVITITTGEKELVDFLYNLGSRNSLIRVRTMTLGPEPNRMRLQGSLTVVESFQRKAPAKPVATTAPAAKPSTKPPAKAPEKKPAVTSPKTTSSTTNQTKKSVVPGK